MVADRRDGLRDVTEALDRLVAELQAENTVLRAERDEARRALKDALIAFARPVVPAAAKPDQRLVTSRALLRVDGLSCRKAALVLGVSAKTIANARNRRVAEQVGRPHAEKVRGDSGQADR